MRQFSSHLPTPAFVASTQPATDNASATFQGDGNPVASSGSAGGSSMIDAIADGVADAASSPPGTGTSLGDDQNMLANMNAAVEKQQGGFAGAATAWQDAVGSDHGGQTISDDSQIIQQQEALNAKLDGDGSPFAAVAKGVADAASSPPGTGTSLGDDQNMLANMNAAVEKQQGGFAGAATAWQDAVGSDHGGQTVSDDSQIIQQQEALNAKLDGDGSPFADVVKGVADAASSPPGTGSSLGDDQNILAEINAAVSAEHHDRGIAVASNDHTADHADGQGEAMGTAGDASAPVHDIELTRIWDQTEHNVAGSAITGGTTLSVDSHHEDLGSETLGSATPGSEATGSADAAAHGGDFWDQAALASQHATADLGSNDIAHVALDTAAQDAGGPELDSMRLQSAMSSDDREFSELASIAHDQQGTAQNVVNNIGGDGTGDHSHGNTSASEFGAAVVDHGGGSEDHAAVTTGDVAPYAVPGSMDGADIEALAFLVLMEAAKSAQEDVASVMAGVKAINNEKEMLRDEFSADNKLVASSDHHDETPPPHYEPATTTDFSHHWPL